MAKASFKEKVSTSGIILLILMVIGGFIWLAVWDIQTAKERSNAVAMEGYDVVALHKVGKVIKGRKNTSWFWNNQAWWFSTSEHRALFMAQPAAYAPQYGGNCAFTTSLGKEQLGLTRYWNITNGRLYLNSNHFSNFLWKHMSGRIAKADKHWLRLNEEKARKKHK